MKSLDKRIVASILESRTELGKRSDAIEDIRVKLNSIGASYNAIVENYNQAVDEYNSALEDVICVVDEVVDEIHSFVDDRSDKWRDGDQAKRYEEWVSAIEELKEIQQATPLDPIEDVDVFDPDLGPLEEVPTTVEQF